jgi:Holliday junction resolvase RusA-like endonuclease
VFARNVIVFGTPVSLQAKTSTTRDKWKTRVADAARDMVPAEDRFEYGSYGDIDVAVVYFHFGEMIGDLDNIAKPILDALNGPLWSDDRQIAHLRMRRVQLDPPRPLSLRDPPPIVSTALERAREIDSDFVFVSAEPSNWDGRLQ